MPVPVAAGHQGLDRTSIAELGTAVIFPSTSLTEPARRPYAVARDARPRRSK
jgi:hypothetical protein